MVLTGKRNHHQDSFTAYGKKYTALCHTKSHALTRMQQDEDLVHEEDSTSRRVHKWGLKVFFTCYAFFVRHILLPTKIEMSNDGIRGIVVSVPFPKAAIQEGPCLSCERVFEQRKLKEEHCISGA